MARSGDIERVADGIICDRLHHSRSGRRPPPHAGSRVQPLRSRRPAQRRGFHRGNACYEKGRPTGAAMGIIHIDHRRRRVLATKSLNSAAEMSENVFPLRVGASWCRQLRESSSSRQSSETLSKMVGAGFELRVTDLEQRGAGDLLGEEQAGHLRLIGTELYRHVLARAIAHARGEPWRRSGHR
jgi:hypothetical protein